MKLPTKKLRKLLFLTHAAAPIAAIAALCLAAGMMTGAAAAEPATKPEPAATAPAAKPDPTSAIVAEGHQIYRQRDLDALVLIAARHVRTKLSNADEDQLRQALTRLLVAREPLVEALASLPANLTSGKARDALLLDLIDYQAEIAKPPVAASADTAKPAADAAKPAGDAKDAKGVKETKDAKDAKEEPKAQQPDIPGPVIVSLPTLQQTRTLDKIGKRQLTLQIALYFPDAATARVFEPKAPLIRDAILGYVHELPASEFAEPDQVALKKGLVAAITARVADFPADGILIPQLEVGAPDDKDKDKDK